MMSASCCKIALQMTKDCDHSARLCSMCAGSHCTELWRQAKTEPAGQPVLKEPCNGTRCNTGRLLLFEKPSTRLRLTTGKFRLLKVLRNPALLLHTGRQSPLGKECQRELAC